MGEGAPSSGHNVQWLTVRRVVCTVVPGMLLGFALVVGGNVMTSHAGRLSDAATWGVILLVGAFCSLLLLGVFWLLDRVPLRGGRLRWREPRFATLLATGIIFASWLPYFLALYPGAYSYDTPTQVAQVMGVIPMTTQHPVVHTLLIGFFVWLGKDVLGSYVTGMALCTILQMIVTALAFGYTATAVGRITRSTVGYVLALVWFAVFPVNGLMAVSCTKDVYFAAAFCWFMAQLVQVLQRGERPTAGQLVLLGIAGLAALLLRTNMVYAWAVFSVVATVVVCVRVLRHGAAQRGRDLALVAMLWSALALSWLVTGPIYAAGGVSHDINLRESLSLPSQQMARVVAREGEISARDQQSLGRLMPKLTPETYHAYLADYAKSALDMDYLPDHMDEFWKTYQSIGSENVDDYVDAFLELTVTAWYPLVPGNLGKPYLELEVSTWYDTLGAAEYYIPHEPVLPELASAIYDAVEMRPWEGVPILGLLMSQGFLVWPPVVAFFWLLSSRKNAVRALPLVLPLLYWGTLLLGPTIITRYVYPLCALEPVVIALVVSGMRGRDRAEVRTPRPRRTAARP